jgi:hypothetical protein
MSRLIRMQKRAIRFSIKKLAAVDDILREFYRFFVLWNENRETVHFLRQELMRTFHKLFFFYSTSCTIKTCKSVVKLSNKQFRIWRIASVRCGFLGSQTPSGGIGQSHDVKPFTPCTNRTAAAQWKNDVKNCGPVTRDKRFDWSSVAMSHSNIELLSVQRVECDVMISIVNKQLNFILTASLLKVQLGLNCCDV